MKQVNKFLTENYRQNIVFTNIIYLNIKIHNRPRETSKVNS